MVKQILMTLGVAALATAPLGAQRRSDVITAEEIDRARPSVGTAYDVVRRLRPRWLRSPDVIFTGRPDDPLTSTRVHVYLDDVDVGDATYLETIPAERVLALRWLSANQAASRFGPSAGPGIVVTLKR